MNEVDRLSWEGEDGDGEALGPKTLETVDLVVALLKICDSRSGVEVLVATGGVEDFSSGTGGMPNKV